MLHQAVAVKQCRWEVSGAWRLAGTARRSGTVSLGGMWAEPGRNAAILCLLDVLFEQ